MDHYADRGDEITAILARDLHRPRYHFLPPANWLNDPNGLIQWKDQYHLFYQYNPTGPFHGYMHWGHAISADLVHWQHLPIALAPTPDGPDEGGAWSGCAVDNHGVPTLLYTGVFPQVLCLAWSDDDLLTWHKHRQPIIATPPAELDIVGGEDPAWRDPWVWQEADRWYMLIGSGIRNVGGTALLYESADLIQWTYLHPILTGDSNDPAEVWECPNLFPLGDRHLLLISILPESRHTYYFTGDYTQQQFHPASRGKADHGAYFYAAQAMSDKAGRRLMWGWIKEGRSREKQWEAGWSGVMSLPRVLELLPDGTLSMTIAPELMALRDHHQHWSDIIVALEANEIRLEGRALEIIAEFEPLGATRFGFWIHCAPDHAERTLIAYDTMQQVLVIDRQVSSLDSDVDKQTEVAPRSLTADEPLKLHLYIDHSVVEVFAGKGVCLTTRVYPTRSDSAGVSVVAFDGQARLKALDVWTMKAI